MFFRKDSKYNFKYFFDPKTGAYMRTDVLDKNGKSTGKEPFMGSFPHLIDVGIMGHCTHGQTGLCQAAGIECYQSGPHEFSNNMPLSDFESICKQCTGYVTQFALGGRGDPDQHENFKEILKMCRDYDIVPNFTTSGYGMTKEIAELCEKYCGAVAVSQYSRLKHVIIGKYKTCLNDKDAELDQRDGVGEVYLESAEMLSDYTENLWSVYHHCWDSEAIEFKNVYYEAGDYTINAIKTLIDAGVTTNVHYVVGNQTIDELLTRLRLNAFPKGINALILLLHKPVGLGSEHNVLKTTDKRVIEMYHQITKSYPFKIGMDSCNVPGAINFCNDVLMESLDTCEGGRFSCYIGSDMVMVPCSFDQKRKYACDLTQMTIKEAWDSNVFEQFRDVMRNACPNCEKREMCLGGCPLNPDIVLCKHFLIRNEVNM